MTRIRQVAPLLHIINFNNLCFRVETLISAKNRVDLSSISEVRSYITEWPRFFVFVFVVCCVIPTAVLATGPTVTQNSPFFFSVAMVVTTASIYLPSHGG